MNVRSKFCVRCISTGLALTVMVFVASSLHGANHTDPEIALADRSVTVKNITPGEAVVLLGGWQRIGDAIELTRWRQALVDADKDGAVRFDLDRDMPTDAIWVAVDVRTGRVAAAAPLLSQFRKLDFPAAVLRKGASGAYERYVSGRRMVDLLVVRPHVGAWAAQAIDGHGSDADQRQDGRTTIVFEQARLVGAGAPAPRHLTPRDVVVAIDVRRMEYYFTEVAE